MADADDRAAAGWLCAALPDLRAGALGDDRVLGRLDEAADAVRDGEPAGAVCRRLGYPTRHDPDKAADLPSLADFGLDPVSVQGHYRCPHGRCHRRARADELGREPVCAIDDAPMVLRPR